MSSEEERDGVAAAVIARFRAVRDELMDLPLTGLAISELLDLLDALERDGARLRLPCPPRIELVEDAVFNRGLTPACWTRGIPDQ